MRAVKWPVFVLMVLLLVTGCNGSKDDVFNTSVETDQRESFKPRPLTVEEYKQVMAPHWQQVVSLRRKTQDQIWTELRSLVAAGKEDEALEFSRRMGEQQSHMYMAMLAKIVGVVPPPAVVDFHTNFIRFLAYSELASRLTADLQGRPDELSAAGQVAEKSNLIWKKLSLTGQELFGEEQ